MSVRPVTHPREQIAATMDRIYRHRMTTTSGGNLSIRGTDGDIWVSPARVDKGRLKPDDVVRVLADGSTEGPHPPSSEFPFHRAVYAARPDVGAIVHAHPPGLVSFSICRQTPRPRLLPVAHDVCGQVGFAPYACPGSEALGEVIAQTFSTGADCVVLENHGVVVGHDSLDRAFQRFETFEFLGRTEIEARKLGSPHELTDDQLAHSTGRLHKFTPFDPPPASPAECELRTQLADFTRRGCRQRLLISTQGSFSARLDDRSFLITPTGQDRELLSPEDIVLITGDQCEAGKRPSRAAAAHRAIYDAHPDVNAVVFAHPIHGSAFSVTDEPLNVRTIPESFVFLQDVARVPFGEHLTGGPEIAGHVRKAGPGVLLQNDGAVMTGTTVLDAFDRLEVLDATAEALLTARPLGGLSVMSDEVIDELRAAFNLP